MRVEVDWDALHSAGGFQPDDALDCAPALPDDPDYEPLPCEANSPAFRVPGTAQVAIRVTDTVDGTQAAADAAGRRRGRRGSAAPSPASAARPSTCALRARPAVQCGPGNGRKTSGGGDKVPHTGMARGDGDPVEGARQRPGTRRSAAPTTTSCSATTAPTASSAARARTSCGATGIRRTTTPARRTSSTAGRATTGSIPATAPTVVEAGSGKDYVWAYYGRGTIDCGPGPGHRSGQAQRPVEAAQLRARPALLRLRLRRPRRLPEARREEADGPEAPRSGRVGRGARGPLKAIARRRPRSARATTVLGARWPRDGERQGAGARRTQLDGQERAAAALGRDEGGHALARLGAGAKRRTPRAGVRAGGQRGPARWRRSRRGGRASRPRWRGAGERSTATPSSVAEADSVRQQLRAAEILAEEATRLERGLLPVPILNDPALRVGTGVPPGPRANAPRRGLLRPGAHARRRRCDLDDRRRQRPRRRRGRPRRRACGWPGGRRSLGGVDDERVLPTLQQVLDARAPRRGDLRHGLRP